MPTPDALLEVQLQRINNAAIDQWNAVIHNVPSMGMGPPTLAPDAVDRIYVVAWIGGRFMGRSRRMAANAAVLDLTGDTHPQIWLRRLRVRAGDNITIRVEVWKDTL